MADNDLRTRDNEREFSRVTGEDHVLILKPRPLWLLEVHDVHFDNNSAVMLPDCRVDDHEVDGQPHEEHAGVMVIAACLRYAKEHPTQNLLISGNTDTSGEDAYNEELSRKRANNVLFIIEGTDEAREKWRQLSDDQSKVEDYQLILKWVNNHFRATWNCDPGAVDNDHRSMTTRAVENFQSNFKAEFLAPDGIVPQTGQEMAVDGDVGPQTWGAIFDFYQFAIREMLSADETRMQEVRAGLHFVDDDKKAVGCGEYFPIEEPERDDHKSHENRRVELLFFEDEDVPLLDCHPDETTCVKEICEVHNRRAYQRNHIPVTPLDLDELWRLKIVRPSKGKLSEWPVIADEPFVLRRAQAGPDAEIRGRTNAQGILQVRVFDEDEEMTLEIKGTKLKLHGGDLPAAAASNEKSIKLRLFNIGYGTARPERWTDPEYRAVRRAFKKREMNVDDDVIDDAMVAKLREVHGS